MTVEQHDPIAEAYAAGVTDTLALVKRIREQIAKGGFEDVPRDSHGRWTSGGGSEGTAGNLSDAQRREAVGAITRNARVFRGSGGELAPAEHLTVDDRKDKADKLHELATAINYSEAPVWGPMFTETALNQTFVIVATSGDDIAGAHGFNEVHLSGDDAKALGSQMAIGDGIMGSTGIVPGTGSALAGAFIREAANRDAAILIHPVAEAKGFWTKMGMRPLPWGMGDSLLFADAWGMSAAEAKRVAAQLDQAYKGGSADAHADTDWPDGAPVRDQYLRWRGIAKGEGWEQVERDSHGRWSSGGDTGTDTLPALELLTSSDRVETVDTIGRNLSVFRAVGGATELVQGVGNNETIYPFNPEKRALLDKLYDMRDNIDWREVPNYAADYTEAALKSYNTLVATVDDGDGLAGAYGFKVRDVDEVDHAPGVRPSSLLGSQQAIGFGILGTTGIAPGTGSALAEAVIRQAAKYDAAIVIHPVVDARGFWTKMGMRPLTFMSEDYGLPAWGMTAADAKRIADGIALQYKGQMPADDEWPDGAPVRDQYIRWRDSRATKGGWEGVDRDSHGRWTSGGDSGGDGEVPATGALEVPSGPRSGYSEGFDPNHTQPGPLTRDETLYWVAATPARLQAIRDNIDVPGTLGYKMQKLIEEAPPFRRGDTFDRLMRGARVPKDVADVRRWNNRTTVPMTLASFTTDEREAKSYITGQRDIGWNDNGVNRMGMLRPGDQPVFFTLEDGAKALHIGATFGGITTDEWVTSGQFKFLSPRGTTTRALDNTRVLSVYARQTTTSPKSADVDLAKAEGWENVDRDALGRWTSEGGGSAMTTAAAEHAATIRHAIEAFHHVRHPSAAEVAAQRALYAKYGAAEVESRQRGSSHARAASRARLLREWGDGKHCRCVYCGKELDDSTVTRDRIIPGSQGGRYRYDNLVPADIACNKSRSDTPFEKVVASWQAQGLAS